MSSIITSALHRLGVVQQLRTLWRRDIEKAGLRAATRAEKSAAAQRAIEETHKAVAREQRMQAQQLGDTAATVRAVAAQVVELEEQYRRLHERAKALEEALGRNRQEGAQLEALRAAADNGTLAQHVAAAIAAAPLHDDPAPMLVVERLFPDDIFAALLAAIPPAEAFIVKDRTKADYRTRRPRTAVPDLAAATWSYLDEDLIPRTMVPAIAARFRRYIDKYYRELLGDEIGAAVATLPLEATDARLMLRRPGYHLDPHLDPKRVLLTGLLYFPRPGDSEEHGTSFYRVDGQVVRDHATTYYPVAAGHRCELVRSVPFRPNTAVVFFNTAAHGADLPATLPKGVERYALQFYVGPPVGGLRDMLRRLPESEQRAWQGLLE
jgi:hypothetical protein